MNLKTRLLAAGMLIASMHLIMVFSADQEPKPSEIKLILFDQNLKMLSVPDVDLHVAVHPPVVLNRRINGVIYTSYTSYTATYNGTNINCLQREIYMDLKKLYKKQAAGKPIALSTKSVEAYFDRIGAIYKKSRSAP